VYTGNAEHTSWITAFSFLPITIWRLDAALCSRRLQPAAEAGAVWGLHHYRLHGGSVGTWSVARRAILRHRRHRAQSRLGAHFNDAPDGRLRGLHSYALVGLWHPGFVSNVCWVLFGGSRKQPAGCRPDSRGCSQQFA
jgi:hypothetical protein